MTALARRVAVALTAENLPYAEPLPYPANGGLREVLGQGRLTAAIEAGDTHRVDELIDWLLEHPTVGRRIAGRVWCRMGDVITGEGPGPAGR